MSRAAILEKIRALLSKTTANGCTEAEALAALAKDFATWLLSTLGQFVESQLVDYMLGCLFVGARRRQMVKGFVFGACNRIAERLEALSRPHAASTAEYYLPDGYKVAESNYGELEIYDPQNRHCEIIEHMQTRRPQLASGGREMPVLKRKVAASV